MIPDEIKNGMLEMEHRFSAKLDNAIEEVKEELCVERASRQQLEERVAQLEQQHVREQAASTAQLFEDEDVDKSVVVVGGFGDTALEDAKALVQQMMVGTTGFNEVDMINVEQPIALATFDTPASALKFIRAQKKNHIMQTDRLWAAENRSKTERTRCKIVSKLTKYMIELGGFSAMVNGQWSTLYAPLGSLFQAQGKSETISYVHYHLQKCKNSARLEDHKS